jgi:CheY-like chemotaxis protein
VVVPSGARAETAAVAASPATLGTPREWPAPPVLVVDDDPLVLAATRALLCDLGCEVTVASDAAAAVAAVMSHGTRRILVLCDYRLSRRVDGIQLLDTLSRRAAARISGILISGDTGYDVVRAAKDAGYPLLHKPVSPSRLRAMVAEFASKHHAALEPAARDENPSG